MHAPEQQTAKVYVVPRIENTYKTGMTTKERKFAPTFRPPSNDAPVGGEGGDRFEMAAPIAQQITTGFGLQKRERDSSAVAGTSKGDNRAGLGGSITERLTAQQQEDQTYQKDVEALPEEASLEVSGAGKKSQCMWLLGTP